MKEFLTWAEKFFSREFLVALVVIISTLIQSDLLPATSPWVKVGGWIVAALTALGYGVARTIQKGNEQQK